ncbi:MAG: HAD-IA family hydrolase [Bacteroidota bacterium]
MDKKLLVFDFDGTIADTLSVALLIVNEIGEKLEWPAVDKEEFIELKRKTIPELLKIANLNVSQLPGVLRKARRSFKQHLQDVKPIEGMPEVIVELKQRGYRMGILTSNSKPNVQRFLKQHQLGHFEFIYAPSSLFGKAPVLQKIMRRRKFDASELVMIGDEQRDMAAAQEAGIDGIGVTWGFHTPVQLETSSPAHILNQPEELLTLFQQPVV